MPIKVRCSHCQSQFSAEARFEGRMTECPSCKHPLKIRETENHDISKAAVDGRSKTDAPTKPSSSRKAKPSKQGSKPPPAKRKSVQAAPSRKQIAEKLLRGFQGPIQRTRPTIGYRFGSLVVALLMILLPAIYIAGILLVGYGVYYHAVYDAGMLEVEVRGRGYLLVIIAYLAPMACGAILIVFMIKPLFFSSSQDMRTRSLRRESEPLLFAFVDRICEAVGAPRPKRIDLDCNVNASASFRRGWLSMLGNDLVLTIGLPLVSGLNTRQFAGVLAHEFGHFAQGAGMRLTYVIRSISHWLLRVVYQRDRADQWLAETAHSMDIRIGWIFYLSMLFVWITRGFLWVLMVIGNVVGSYLLRQMEFDADRYEARLAGSQAFEQTARQLHYLNAATQAAYADLSEFYREGRLGDDLPQLILSRVNQLPADLKQALDDSIDTSTTGWFDTHPADSDRIANAIKEKSQGVFQIEMASSVLFENYEAQSKATTWEFYLEQFGHSLDRGRLRPVSEMIAKQEQNAASQAALERYFQGNWCIARPLPFRSYVDTSPAEPQERLDTLRSAREAMIRDLEGAKNDSETLHNALNELATAYYMRYCLRANLKLESTDKQFLKNPSGKLKLQIEKAEVQLSKSSRAVDKYQTLAAQRLMAALELLHVPQVAKRIPQARVWRQESGKLLACAEAISGRMDSIVKVSRLFSPMETLVGHLTAGDQSDALVTVVEGLMKDLYPLVRELRESWKRYDYPYEHSENQLLLATYLVPEVPVKNDLASVYRSCDQVVNSAPKLYTRVLSDLTAIAEAVETAIGLPQLPVPKDDANSAPS